MDRTTRLIPAVLGIAMLAAGCEPSQEALVAEHTSTIDRYCLDCHNAIDQEAGLVLEGIDLAAVHENAELMEKMILKLDGRMMPPPGGRAPSNDERESLIAFFEDVLAAEAAEHPMLGRMSAHRLNRTEYGNAVRDLLGLRIDAAEFLPADDEAYGFDNIADVLRVSPPLLEQYLSASSKIAALAVGDPETRVVNSVYRAPPDLGQYRHIDGLPLGTRGGLAVEHYFPLDAEYDFAVFLTRNIVGYMTGLEWPHELEISIDGERVFIAPVGGEEDNLMSDRNFSAAADTIDARLRTRVFVEAGEHEVAVAFLRRNSAQTEEPLQLHTRDQDLQNMNGVPMIDYVTLIGPIDPQGPGDTASRRAIFTCHPETRADELPCAEEILSRLGRRAYRKPLTEDDLGELLDLYELGANTGFERGIQTAIRGLLASPKFLFRSNEDPEGLGPGDIFPLDDYALASRLSFFLWSSIPDATLLELAAANRLNDPEVYAAEVRRMLADPKSQALIDNFAGQWLFLRNLQSARPDVATFPNFDENLRRALRKETELLFASIVREDRSVIDLLDADYTFLNERLAQHYGVPGIYGSHFRRVEGLAEERRGLLGQGSILTITSLPNRTSPVIRGKWIMENILGTPPPPPLPNVPSLAENQPGEVERSVRERLAAHRENPICATCHDILDPLGLALENYNAVGQWRVREPGGEVDARGELADGTRVEGVVELRKAIMRNPERFVSVVTQKLMTYALGRGVEYFDMPTVRAIVADAAESDYAFSALVMGIATSDQFRMKQIQAPESPESL
jgi:Protein of unknown function (DUF1592)/Protein of unknown function (DUF1588)/Protein of unknown function (DUF1587)/Protein of unknown function (DUF1585)/Protein of unknown function (DUF1595)/Planctomycete cytochrome C